MNTSFTKKLLEAHITLAEGGFNTATGQGANTKIIRLGMDVDIQKPGGKEKNKAKVNVLDAKVCRKFETGDPQMASDHLPVYVELELL